MQTERPPTQQPVSARSSPARGIVLIAAAVVLGLFLLRALEDSAPSDVATAPTGTTAAPGDESTGTTAAEGGESTTTAAPVRLPAEVVVRVANAARVQGAAGARTEQLAAAGYQTVDPTNAPGEPLAATQVLFVEGF